MGKPDRVSPDVAPYQIKPERKTKHTKKAHLRSTSFGGLPRADWISIQLFRRGFEEVGEVF